ncbi:MAG: hypothetical protein R2753_16020 [Chitinophagales bacterium]
MVAYIKDLLRFHDYVIIPTLGGFITHYEPAKRSISTGTIAAPSKKIAFNQSLREDDGLLINYLVTQKGISQAKAKAKVLDFIEEIQEALNDHDFYLFSGIGKLQLDVSGNYQFLPILKENLLLESYGLERVVAEPIQRIKEAFETNQEKVIDIATAETVNVLNEPVEEHELTVVKEKEYQPWFFRAAAVIGMGFIMTTVGISLFNGNVSGDQLSLFPVQQKVEIFEGVAAIENNIDLAQPKLSDVHLYEAQVVEAIAETTDVVTQVEEAVSVLESSQYHIIVGSFLDDIRMNREIANMEAKGFAVQTLEGPNGYTRVALVFDANNTNKDTKLQEVRANVNPDAWMVGG